MITMSAIPAQKEVQGLFKLVDVGLSSRKAQAKRRRSRDAASLVTEEICGELAVSHSDSGRPHD